MFGGHNPARVLTGSGLIIGGQAQGWAFSLFLHAAAVSTVAVAMNGMSVLPEQEPFRWEVALMEPSRQESSAQPARNPRPLPSEPVTPAASPEPPQPMVSKPIEPEPVVQTIEPVREVVETMTASAYTAPETAVEKIEPAVQPTPVPPAEPPPAQPTQVAALPPAASSIAEPPAAPTDGVAAAPAVTAQSSQGSVRADYGWLAEMLWRRVAELKRYPGTARLNGWEGRVVVRAVIQMDGHLTNLSVAESSGHEILDQAAMDAVRLACPLKLKHHLFGRSTVVVQVPINYKLTN